MQDWFSVKKMQLNAAKSKELFFDFKRSPHSFSPVSVSGSDLSFVDSAKILGLTVSSDLSWNAHVQEVIKKANKRLYFLILLLRAGIPPKDIVNFYCMCG